jgi:AraC-like DNA-binding protein
MTKNPFILALKAYNLTVEIHHHSAYQLVLSNDALFTSTIDGKVFDGIYGFLIKPQVTHHCLAENGTLNILNIEPYSTVGLTLSKRFEEAQYSIIFHSVQDAANFFQLAENLMDINSIMNNLHSGISIVKYDERITLIVEYINAHHHQQGITPQTFADIVFLSPSRLASLFKQQTGSSLSKYLLWTRLRHVIYLTLSQKERSLTDIAYDTGFYDLPQLNKYMYEMFGMPPKALKQNSDLIQLY